VKKISEVGLWWLVGWQTYVSRAILYWIRLYTGSQWRCESAMPTYSAETKLASRTRWHAAEIPLKCLVQLVGLLTVATRQSSLLTQLRSWLHCTARNTIVICCRAINADGLETEVGAVSCIPYCIPLNFTFVSNIWRVRLTQNAAMLHKLWWKSLNRANTFQNMSIMFGSHARTDRTRYKTVQSTFNLVQCLLNFSVNLFQFNYHLSSPYLQLS